VVTLALVHAGQMLNAELLDIHLCVYVLLALQEIHLANVSHNVRIFLFFILYALYYVEFMVPKMLMALFKIFLKNKGS